MLVKLTDICEIIPGFAFKSQDFNNNGFPVIKITDICPPTVDTRNCSHVDLSKYNVDKLKKYLVQRDDIVFAMTGATIGKIGRVLSGMSYINQRVAKFVANNEISQKYLYYVLSSDKFYKHIQNNIDSSSAQPNISGTNIGRYTFSLHDPKTQSHIVNILGTIDDKIENNEEIISNLLNLANAKYLSFVAKNSFQIKKIDDVFDIAIGRTPPRKENEWFTIKPDGMKWISIADMGKCDGYIFNTSENLTYDAVKSFNIPIIPENTVILSFKLTVGRIAITSEKMLSNEAIAHFKTDNYKLVPYLYLFLKNYDFNKLGSTSSIATATNSKAVKSINFPLPDVKQIDEFYKVINPFFDKIKYLQYVNKKLQETKNLYLKKFFG